MTAHAHAIPDTSWVIWNGSAGLLVMGTIGRIEVGPQGRQAWLDRPFDMVGPFSLDELEAEGRIVFAACMVMSRQRWQADQAQLRREAHAQRRAAQERIFAQYAHAQRDAGHRRAGWPGRTDGGEPQHREALSLPQQGQLEATQIKAAFRRLAQKAHPDVGGSHEQFIRLTAARDALLAQWG